jgi:hypothetical protein
VICTIDCIYDIRENHGPSLHDGLKTGGQNEQRVGDSGRPLKGRAAHENLCKASDLMHASYVPGKSYPLVSVGSYGGYGGSNMIAEWSCEKRQLDQIAAAI